MTSSMEWASVVFLAAALVLPVSALAGMRLQWKRGVVMALAWAWIFVLMVIAIKTLGYG